MRTVHTTAALIESLAYRSGHPIEMTADAAFLTVGNVTWVAPLPEVSRQAEANIAAYDRLGRSANR